MAKYKADDINLLLPSVRDAAALLLARMQAAGFKPVPFDTLRTPEEAARNALKGKGIVDSMHCYGVAIDVICDDHGWECAKHGCKFFQVLGITAESLGFVWGGRFPKVDMPHSQAVPVHQQMTIRQLGRKPESAAARDMLCKAWLTRKR